MTNSLRKDSHIALGFPIPKNALPYYNSTGARLRKQYNSVPENNSIGICVNKPAEINFCGLSSRTLANDVEFKTLVEAAKGIIGKGKKEFKGVMQLMRDAADFLLPQTQKDGKTPKTPSETVKRFVDSNKSLLQKMVDRAKELTQEDNLIWVKDQENPANNKLVPKMIQDPNNKSKKIIEYRANPEEMRDDVLNSITDATDATLVVGRKPWYENNRPLNYFLKLAEKNNVAFSATFALILTGIFRPAAIVALPGAKKNKDDQKYAAAHSIASGVIGYICATAVSKPVADGLKRVLDDPTKYMKDKNKAGYLEASKKVSRAANNWVTRGVDIAMAIPKAFITIALIPPILKYIFGWEKKKYASTPVNIQTNYNKNAGDKIEPRTLNGGIK